MTAFRSSIARVLAPLLFAAGLLASAAASAAAVPYAIDPNHTQVRFGWTHFGFSHIQARFDKVTGTFLFDPEHPADSRVDVTIPVSSISTGVPDLDEHLQSSDFFDVATFPDIRFTSTAVRVLGQDRLEVRGNLSVHGITRPVVLAVTINKLGVHPLGKRAAAGFDATTTLSRSAFGLGLFVPNVSDAITVHITLESQVPKPQPPAAG
jgi:polyisoprenoid-binding protein YceI